MKESLKSLQELLKTITKPNPKLYSDPSAHQFAWNKNITSFYICLMFLVFANIFVIISRFSLIMNLKVLFVNIWVLISFVSFCRSHLWIFNLIYVVISVVYGFIGFDILPDNSYLYVGYIFMIVACIVILSGSVKLTLAAGTVHFIVCLTRFRENLATLVRDEDPDVFAEKFARSLAFFFVLMVFTNIALVKTLDKRTMELLRMKFALESALDQQKTFIFSFSHELRNPINSLLGNLQLVLQGGGEEVFSAKAKEMINIAKVCGELLLHNINNVLDTGKHDIGKLEIQPVSTQVSELFQQTWGIYAELLRQKKLKGQLKLDKELPAVVKIDSHKVNQILLNLIGNSIKFTEKGSVTVTVKWLKYNEINEKCFEPVPYDDTDEGLFEKEENLSTMMNTSRFSDSVPGFQGVSEDGSGRQSHRSSLISTRLNQTQQRTKGILKIIVKDTGSGMKKEAMEKLFHKFSQVSENISQRNIGTGLGLFITKEICLAMGGEIRAYSKFGVGSTFVVCIPTISIPLDNVQKAGSETIIRQLMQRRLRALIADDSPFNVDLITNYFSQFGGSIISRAYNGYDAFVKYKECYRELDVVTLDIDMPIMDGKRVCDKIREYERENRLKPVVIVLISGNYDKEQIDEYINPERGHRADGFLRKPVSFSEFNRAIYKFVTD